MDTLVLIPCERARIHRILVRASRSVSNMLEAGHVHVWEIALDREGTGSATALLSAAEQHRAARFTFADDRRRFARAHAALRLLIGSYLETDPRLVEFEQRGGHGKPAVAGSELQFSMSH